MKSQTRTYSLKPLLLFALVFTACKKDNTVNLPPVVNAGPSQTITLPVDSVLLRGTAMDGDSKIKAYLWSEVSGPNVPVIASEGSLSTEVNGLTVGTYIFQLMAVDTFGLTGVDTVQVMVNPPGMLILAPINNPFEFTFAANDTGGNISPGPNWPELDAVAWTISASPIKERAAFGFDLASLPANIPIKSAKLTLYSCPTPLNGNLSTPDAGPTNAMYIRRISSSWNPAIATWPTQPTTDTTGQILIPQENLGSLDLVNIDVTALVRTMILSGNNGFMIQLQNEVIYNSRIYCSSKYSDASKHPKLVINY